MHPTNVYAEFTPHPNTMKFVADRVIFSSADPVEYKDQQEARGSSELAVQLFNFPFVEGVFIAKDFVTVTKTESLDWDMITFELREFIRQSLLKTEFVVEHIPEFATAGGAATASEAPIAKNPRENVEPSEYDEAIEGLLKEYVKPAVESDGGAIDYVSFKDGTVTVQLRGSCSGCPSSIDTLKGGIEKLLATELPAVKEVVAESV
jgi:Fe-S cluster biogenesis protein NfuA